MSEVALCSRVLKGGGQLNISIATPPLSKSLIKAFLRTPELSETRHESKKRLYGGLRGLSTDYFLVGRLGEKIVGLYGIALQQHVERSPIWGRRSYTKSIGTRVSLQVFSRWQ